MGMAENTRKRGREQAGMSREGRRTMEKVLENTVRDIQSECTRRVRVGGDDRNGPNVIKRVVSPISKFSLSFFLFFFGTNSCF